MTVKELADSDEANAALQEIETYLHDRYGEYCVGTISIGFNYKKGKPEQAQTRILGLTSPIGFAINAFKGCYVTLGNFLGLMPPNSQPPIQTGIQ